MKNKRVIGIVLIVLVTAILTAVPVNAEWQSSCPPTSLEVRKEITCVERSGDTVTVYFTIYIQNDVENEAWIVEVRDIVEAKVEKNIWDTLADEQVGWHITLPAGDSMQINDYITFTAGDYKTYRNVARVLICNHPSGDHWFKYRVSFEVPEALI